MTLEEKIIEYGKKKQIADVLDKELKELNIQIKKEMQGLGLKTLQAGNFIASYTVRESTSFNEERLLKRLQDLGLQKAIKMVPKPDEKILEDMIYHGELDAGHLEDCLDKKQTTVLTIKSK